MNIVIFHGTPKSDIQTSYSIAYIDFLQHHFSTHNYSVFNIGSDFKKRSKTGADFEQLMEAVQPAEAVIFVMPVYSALVPGTVKSFIERINDDTSTLDLFAGKYASTVTTSANVLDHFAAQYVQAVCEDWQMHYVETFFGTIAPIIDKQYRTELHRFFSRFFQVVEKRLPVQRMFNPLHEVVSPYRDPAGESAVKRDEKKMVLVTDGRSTNGNLSEMIKTFSRHAQYEVETVDLSRYDFSHCTGCVQCTPKLVCGMKDGFQQLHEEKILSADALIIAGEITDRYFSSEIKKFFDRGFYQNHIPYMKGKPVALIVSGPLRDHALVRESVTAILELRGAACIDCVSDESADNGTTAALLKRLANNLSDCVEHGCAKPLSFYGVGSQRILRDFAYLAKYPFVGEQAHFKKNGFKSFPQKRIKYRLLTGLLMLKSKLTNPTAVLQEYRKMRSAGFRSLFLDSKLEK